MCHIFLLGNKFVWDGKHLLRIIVFYIQGSGLGEFRKMLVFRNFLIVPKARDENFLQLQGVLLVTMKKIFEKQL